MNIPDLWSLVTGLASIVSLLICLPEKYSNWRKYNVPIASGLAAWTLGRVSCEFSQSVHEIFQDPYLAVILIVVLVFIGTTIYVFSVLAKGNQIFYATLLISVFVSSGITPIFNIYSQINPAIPTQDYLEFAIMKERKGDFVSAINYYQKYVQKIDDKDSEKQVKQKIDTLRYNLLNQVNQK